MKFCWTTLNVKNMDESLKFYQEVAGLPLIRTMEPAPEMKLAFLGSGETQVELIWNAKVKNVNIGNDISIGFEVESLDKFTEFLRQRGTPVHGGPFQPNPKLRFIYVLDPNGLKVQFLENLR